MVKIKMHEPLSVLEHLGRVLLTCAKAFWVDFDKFSLWVDLEESFELSHKNPVKGLFHHFMELRVVNKADKRSLLVVVKWKVHLL